MATQRLYRDLAISLGKVLAKHPLKFDLETKVDLILEISKSLKRDNPRFKQDIFTQWIMKSESIQLRKGGEIWPDLTHVPKPVK